MRNTLEVKKLIKAVEQGDTEAQLDLGWMYYAGKGVKQDYSKAFEWYKKAAEEGHAEAQNELGEMYYAGKGVEQDYRKALEWYTKSAQGGYGPDQQFLKELEEKTNNA